MAAQDLFVDTFLSTLAQSSVTKVASQMLLLRYMIHTNEILGNALNST